ncbi:hypothetical protein [Kribbella sp. NPDC004875]|uniref:hypothetical protein n=1 Tax=Kribbella sp. NPDC004875 TaxID=3364107 RepID=UPI0036C44AE4
MDLLVPRERLAQVKSYAASARNAELPIKLDTVAAFRLANKKSYLTHQKLMFPVSSARFRRRTADLLGKQLETIDPRTLLHTFGTVGSDEPDQHSRWPGCWPLVREAEAGQQADVV